ncbi:predicted protein [Chaetoceros tenuissimus]|uniref:Uncharacterized protein n=1 Tax=Chaetoceros tenuissimus TaxID=426638 RepID=A0AAD3DD65_9STRA|nr:predicted protein [Chaetoceros tenuissimus]GFH62228.1 predicted protein [Chaetoceros tenuissimus]
MGSTSFYHLLIFSFISPVKCFLQPFSISGDLVVRTKANTRFHSLSNDDDEQKFDQEPPQIYVDDLMEGLYDTNISGDEDTDGLSFINKDSEEMKQAANNAENEFLAAMKSVSKDFEVQKDELGVDGAINVMKSQWDLEDKLIDLEEEDISGEFE